MESQIKEYYEKTSERFWSPEKPEGRDLHVIPLIDKRGGRFLEYGFGCGSLLFSQVGNFDEVIGYDISSRLIEKAESYKRQLPENERGKIRFFIAEGDRLQKIESGSVDLLVSVATIEHMFDLYGILDEFHRVVKPGGRLVVSVPNYGYLKHRLSLLIGRQPRTGTDEPVENWRQCGWDGGHLHTFTKSAFKVLLEDTGWRPVRWSGWGNRFSSIRARFPGILSGELFAVCERVAR